MPSDHFILPREQILAKVAAINPRQYAASRNFLSGEVTRLSPYITHGVLQLPDVVASVLATHAEKNCQKLLAEFAWREYFQYLWMQHGDAIFNDLHYPQSSAQSSQMAQALLHGNSGIDVIDQAWRNLNDSGYVHNHARMWTAFMHCHVAKTHWLEPARWYYYHLLDGDLASNFLSWQWVAGTSRQRHYIANQHNLNTYSHTEQSNTCIDLPYEELEKLALPDEFASRASPLLSCNLPEADCQFDRWQHATTLCYSIWNLDPDWHASSAANRVLIVEPSHFQRFPISDKRWQFILHYARQIPAMQVFVGEFSDFQQQLSAHQPGIQHQLIFREHPSHPHWRGSAEPQRFAWPKPKGPIKGFFPFWKHAQGKHQC